MNRREGKAPSQRQLRVGEEIRHALALVLERGELRDPGLAGAPITVTEVRVSPDLRAATAFIIPLGGTDTAAVVEALNRAQPFLRHRLAQSVKLRYAPNISFLADPSFDEANHIQSLLDSPPVRRDLHSASSDSEEEDDGA